MEVAGSSLFDATMTRKWVNHELSERRITGCAMEVVHKGDSVLQMSVGWQNAKRDPVNKDTRFWIASMTKPVASIAALQLIERGELSLQESVSTFVKGFGDAGVLRSDGRVESLSRPPSILDLLTHTTGITYGQFGTHDIHRRYAEARVFDYTSTNAQMADRLAALPLLYQPGTVFEYGMSTDILGFIIEQITGKSLDRVLSDSIFDPLGMHNTGFVPDPKRLAELPPSKIQSTLAPDFSVPPTWHSAGAGLFSTVSDYMRFARMLHGRGQFGTEQIIAPETFALMSQQHLADNIQYGEYTEAFGVSAPWPKNGLSFGLGVAVRTQPHPNIPGGVGEIFWPGVSGVNFWVDPYNDLIVVFLTHAPLHRTTHRLQLRNAIYKGISRAEPK